PCCVLPQPRLDRGRRHQFDERLNRPMYQAIVFLPLIGAIIAGLISLVGARGRHPGGSPSDDSHEHAASAVHGHAAPSLAAPDPAPRETHADPAWPAPAAAGWRLGEAATTSLLFFAMVLSGVPLANAIMGRGDLRIPLTPWFTSGALKVEWALRIDTLTAVM